MRSIYFSIFLILLVPFLRAESGQGSLQFDVILAESGFSVSIESDRISVNNAEEADSLVLNKDKCREKRFRKLSNYLNERLKNRPTAEGKKEFPQSEIKNLNAQFIILKINNKFEQVKIKTSFGNFLSGLPGLIGSERLATEAECSQRAVK